MRENQEGGSHKLGELSEATRESLTIRLIGTRERAQKDTMTPMCGVRPYVGRTQGGKYGSDGGGHRCKEREGRGGKEEREGGRKKGVERGERGRGGREGWGGREERGRQREERGFDYDLLDRVCVTGARGSKEPHGGRGMEACVLQW